MTRDPRTAAVSDFAADLRMLCVGGHAGDGPVLSVPTSPVEVAHTFRYKDLRVNARYGRVMEAEGDITLSRAPVNWDEERAFQASLCGHLPPPPSRGWRRHYSRYHTSPDGLRIEWTLLDEEVLAEGGK